MSRLPYDPQYGSIRTNAGIPTDRGYISHVNIPAPVVAAPAGVHAAFACTTPAVAASCVVKAASAITDILTVTATTALGATANALKILLTTAADDNLAVTKTDGTSTINIALAKTTAAKNTATLIQAAIRALSTVGGIAVTAVTCAAGGNWDTAAVATGESGSVSFSGGVTAADDILLSGITDPDVPRNITATAGGTAGDIKAVSVIIEGTNMPDEVITETLPAFTANTAGIVTGNKAFKTVSKITIPAHDGTGATTAIGFGSKLGLPMILPYDTLLKAFLAGTADASTVAADDDELEKNTITMAGTLNGSSDVDAYFII